MRCKSILVVEDDRDIREAIVQVLEVEGYPVSSAANGAEAVLLLEKIPGPCLILLDLMMPTLTGWEFLEKQKADTVFASLPVVVISALPAKTALADTKAVEKAVGYIKKPVSLDALMEVVQQYCGQGDDEMANFALSRATADRADSSDGIPVSL
ncbi:MAG: response regulator [Bdellovibrionia bacterium]